MRAIVVGSGAGRISCHYHPNATAARGPHDAAAARLLEQIETELAQSTQALRDALRIELV